MVSNLVLIGQPLYFGFLAAQFLFYTTALIGLKISDKFPLKKLFKISAMFVSMNAALFVGLGRWLGGIRGGTWKRTERSEEISDLTDETRKNKQDQDLQEISQ